MFFSKLGNFISTTIPNSVKIGKYSFTVLSPLPSFTGKWAPQFDGTVDTSISVIIVKVFL